MGLGCDSAQGWFVSRPMAPAAATSWLREEAGRRYGLRLVSDAGG